MFEEWLTRLERVRIAKTAQEREAIYAFRYDVYVRELGREVGGVDHARQMVYDDQDELPTTTHAFTGAPGKITGAVRVRSWAPGTIPPLDLEWLGLAAYPEITQLPLAEFGRLMVRPSMRGKLIAPALARAVYTIAVESGADLCFCTCLPGLVPLYRRLGFYPYAAPLFHSPDGMGVPLIGVFSDADGLRAAGSPVAPLVSRYFGPGKRPPFDMRRLAPLLSEAPSTVEVDRDRVWQQVQDDLLRADAGPTILQGLSVDATRKLAAKGFLLDVQAGAMVTRAGTEQRELFIVLDGTFEVRSPEGRRLNVLGRGDLFGELAFFREDGRRTASVFAASDGQLLMLRRAFLAELGKTDPEIALQLYHNLGRLLAERIARLEQGA